VLDTRKHCRANLDISRCRVHATQRRNRSETSNPPITKVSFNHYVLRQFCDFDKDGKIEETIFNHMQNKKEEELHVLIRKVCFETLRSEFDQI
jgi:hypothetical protein